MNVPWYERFLVNDLEEKRLQRQQKREQQRREEEERIRLQFDPLGDQVLTPSTLAELVGVKRLERSQVLAYGR
ncbi:hypothetical protein JNB11_00065 [Kocuria palustris]|nr:hypothetical protein [Kocuria palustris]